jgi:predicted nucleic acid-binding protein
MTLIDSSSWIESLRASGRKEVRDRVTALMLAGQAAWCEPVRLELWNGARGVLERKVLRQLEPTVQLLAVDEQVCEMAIDLAKRARDHGHTVPAVDLMIVACARRYGVQIEHCDRHLTVLSGL